MKKLFGGKKKKKEKPPPVSLEEATEKINRRGDMADERIKKLDVELLSFREQIKKTKAGAAQDVLKARALRILKQKKMYEAQRDMLYNQSFKLDRVSFATEGMKDTRMTMEAVKAGSKELEGTLKILKIDDVDKLQDVITSIVEESNEIQDSIVQGNSVPDQLDEDDLMGELDELGSGAKAEKHEITDARPQPTTSAELKQEQELQRSPMPSFQQMNTPMAMPQHISQVDRDELEVPVVPRSPIQT